jgi:HD domain-containing protein
MQAPSFLERLPIARAAWSFADDRHGNQRRASDEAPFMAHPQEVAALLEEAGATDELVAAGVLHDTVERTPTTLGEIDDRFGSGVADLVGAVTEDPGIRSYSRRKAALREQAVHAGEPAAALFAADKVSKVREYREQLGRVADGGAPPRPRRLSHYTASLLDLERVIPSHPLVTELRIELEQLTPVPVAH